MPGGGESGVALSRLRRHDRQLEAQQGTDRSEEPRPHPGAAESGLFEGCIEWANGSPLQKIRRPLLGASYDEPMSERLLHEAAVARRLQEGQRRPDTGLRLLRLLLDDGGNVVFENNIMGASKAVNDLATTTTQAWRHSARFVHPVVELDVNHYEGAHRTDLQSAAQRHRLRHRRAGGEVDVIADGRHHHPADDRRRRSCAGRRAKHRPLIKERPGRAARKSRPSLFFAHSRQGDGYGRRRHQPGEHRQGRRRNRRSRRQRALLLPNP